MAREKEMTAPKMELRRAREAMPTEPGVYYGRPTYRNPIDTKVEARVVRNRGDGSIVNLYVQEQYSEHDPQFYDWYGPVPTCVEAGT